MALIIGTNANNQLQGTSGDDLLAGRSGDDQLTGGAGFDTAWYGGLVQEYLLGTEDGVLTVTDRQATNGDEGTDQLTTIEQLQFSDARLTVTSERRVNSTTNSDQVQNAVTALADGGYMVTWSSLGQDGDGKGTYAQRYDAAGTPVGLTVTGTAGADRLIVGTQQLLTVDGAAGADVLTGGTGADILLGGADSDTLTGGTGEDYLDGGTGADLLIGGAGGDRYLVDHVSDRLTETGSSGTDLVQASVHHTLGATLEDLLLTGVGNLNGTGNASGNIIQGNSGDNVLDGKGGGDLLRGEGGDDRLVGDTGDDVLIGGTGDDALIGGTGRDILTGGAGADQFVLHAALSATTNVDQLTDFEGGVDTIQLSRGVFTALALGALDPNAFVSGAGVTTAADADDRILYDTTTGALYYDANGDAPGGPIQIATLTGAPALSAGDITVIAPPLNAGAVTASTSSPTSRLTTPTATSAESLAHQIIQGTSGDDLLTGRGGDDELHGGTGSDTAWYGGVAQEYLFGTEDGVLTLTDRQAANGDEGMDQLTGIEQLQFSDTRLTVTSERRVNSETESNQSDGAVTGLADGGYVVTWESFEQDGDFNGVYLQRYDAFGQAVGEEVQVNSITADHQEDSAVTALAGGYVVTWESDGGQDGDGVGVYAQRYDATGQALGGEVPVNTETANDQDDSAVAGLTDGGYVVTWESDGGQDGDGAGVYVQRYDAAGVAAGGEVRVNTETANNQSDSAVTGLADGGYVVTWESDGGQDGDGYGIYAQRYDATGNTVGIEVRVHSTIAGDQNQSAVTALADGGYVVT